MPRKRTIPDEALLDAALDTVRRSGPAALSFGTLASEVGLAGSTLVQRFGSKANLLRAALLLAWDRLDAATAAATASAAPGAAGVVDMLVALSGRHEAHDYADQLLVLREDLRDPVLRARGRQWMATLADAIEARLTDAPGGSDGLGALVVAHWQGTLTVWGFTRRGSLRTAVRRSLESLLDRLLAGPAAARRPATTRRGTV
ncbi:MAG TPA: TetR/AcrR family transcriptional regulator [Acidimicrobiia bacterium]|nr:TetR/AcrR family transcriptional regulator [Acidimicrobiia bacterium]